jgi:alpha-beta hydrolase superfamily lysophospholipase
MKKLIIRSASILLIFTLAGFICIRYIAPRAVLKPYPFGLRTLYKSNRDITPQDFHLTSETLDVVVSDSILLKGWFIHSRIKPAKATILLLHGIRSYKEHMLGFAELLANNGYNSIVYDSRAHGESGGRYCTYGFYEHEDVSEFITQSKMRFDEAAPFAIHGTSFGGAVALLAMASDKRIKCGIIVSTFATFEEIAYDYTKRLTLISSRLLVREVLEYSQQIAKFDVEKIKPEEAAKLIAQPVLIIHGENDRNVSISYGRRIFENLASPHKEWFPVKNGNHYNLWRVGGDEYRQKHVRFFDKWFH